ncbi:MAG: type II toxin-antitoxin system VapC family toxin [Treponema sp.]|nr:type II toxin-antitoxin system VapC family toxin [Treponema sp.]
MRPVYLLDTNVISELVKPTPNSSVLEKLVENGKFCAICSTVWQESVYGYERMPEGKRKNKVATYLARIKGSYDIIPYDTFASQICGELQAACERKGKSIPRYDSQIAATAIANGMILITHNMEDYQPLIENSTLKIEDWWE